MRPFSHVSRRLCTPDSVGRIVPPSLLPHALPLIGSSTTPSTHQASPALGDMDGPAPDALGEELCHHSRTPFISLERESRTQQLLLNCPQSLSLASLSLLRPFNLPIGHRAKLNPVHQGLGTQDLPEAPTQLENELISCHSARVARE